MGGAGFLRVAEIRNWLKVEIFACLDEDKGQNFLKLLAMEESSKVKILLWENLLTVKGNLDIVKVINLIFEL